MEPIHIEGGGRTQSVERPIRKLSPLVQEVEWLEAHYGGSVVNAPETDEHLQRARDLATYSETVANLPEKVKRVMALHDEGLSDRQIAQKLGLSRGTVANRLRPYVGRRSAGAYGLNHARVMEAYEQLMDCAKVAKKLGCSEKSVRNHLRLEMRLARKDGVNHDRSKRGQEA